MNSYPILFDKPPDQLRHIGARGGRAHARNWRLRQRAARRTALPTAHPALPPSETTAQAIARLEAQFPWLGSTTQSAARR